MAQEPPAPPGHQFGDAGVFALSLNHTLLVNTTDLFAGNEEIQASYFAAPSLSLGLAIGAQWLSASPVGSGSGNNSNFIFHVGPRVGYDLRISNVVSFWPQIGVDYRRLDSSSTSTSSVGGVTTSTSTSTTSNAFGLTILAPILLHPTRGFFIGAGPAFYVDFSNSTSAGNSSADNSKITSIGLIATIGGDF
jgi:hypothetical protein